jgi:hypothetical protein
MNDDIRISRRAALARGGQTLAAIAVTVIGIGRAGAQDAKKKKGKSSKDDFYFQDEPGEDGKNCSTCINFTPKGSGQYGADSGDCSLLVGDVCSHCYCQGWTDKKTGKKAGT